MFSVKSNIRPEFKRVEKAADEATYRNIRHAAFSISKRAKSSIKKRKRPSDPGSPPSTKGRGRKNIRGAIFVAATRDEGIIGPRASFVGDVGEAHEFGKKRKGDSYPERSFMGPALLANLDRFAASWRGSIG